jgi:hypothetical protein
VRSYLYIFQVLKGPPSADSYPGHPTVHSNWYKCMFVYIHTWNIYIYVYRCKYTYIYEYHIHIYRYIHINIHTHIGITFLSNDENGFICKKKLNLVDEEDRENFVKNCLHRFVKNSKPLITINSPYNTTENYEKSKKINENLSDCEINGNKCNDEKHDLKVMNNKDSKYDTNNYIGEYIEVGKGANMYMYIYIYTFTLPLFQSHDRFTLNQSLKITPSIHLYVSIYIHTYIGKGATPTNIQIYIYIHIYIYMYVYMYMYIYTYTGKGATPTNTHPTTHV